MTDELTPKPLDAKHPRRPPEPPSDAQLGFFDAVIARDGFTALELDRWRTWSRTQATKRTMTVMIDWLKVEWHRRRIAAGWRPPLEEPI